MVSSSASKHSFGIIRRHILPGLHRLQLGHPIILPFVHLELRPGTTGSIAVHLVVLLRDPDIFPRLQTLELEMLPMFFRAESGELPSSSPFVQCSSIDAQRFEVLEVVIVAVLNHHIVRYLELKRILKSAAAAAMMLTATAAMMLTSAATVAMATTATTTTAVLLENLEFAPLTSSSGEQAIVFLDVVGQPFLGFDRLQLDVVIRVVNPEMAESATRSPDVYVMIRFDAQVLSGFETLEHHLVTALQ